MIGVLVVELDRCMSIQLDTDSKRILQRVYSPCQEGMLDSPERTKNQCLADRFLLDMSNRQSFQLWYHTFHDYIGHSLPSHDVYCKCQRDMADKLQSK